MLVSLSPPSQTTCPLDARAASPSAFLALRESMSSFVSNIAAWVEQNKAAESIVPIVRLKRILSRRLVANWLMSKRLEMVEIVCS